VQAETSRIRKIVDLSIPVQTDTPVYPGDPMPQFCLAHTIASHGFNVSGMEMSSHCGTHCDAPYHFLEDGARIDELPLERFIGRGVIVDARGLEPHSPIDVEALTPHAAAIGPNTIALLHTGWSGRLGNDTYFDHPYLSERACMWLLERGVRTIGIDAMNIDETTDGPIDRAAFPCHREICAAGGVIIENLANLAAVDFHDPLISVLPVRFTGGDAAPARAVAIELEP
jgi:kynurenine formamidase